MSTLSRKSMKILKPDSEMDGGGFFSKLPPEITVDILSRIPIKAVFSCKCVCKSFLGLLKTREFTRSHLSRSVPGLLIHRATTTDVFKIVEFEDSPAIELHELRYKTVLEMDVNETFNPGYGCTMFVEGSANGLLLLRNTTVRSIDHFVCNPITRECIEVPEPEGIHRYPERESSGFGVSRSGNSYKVVRIFYDCVCDHDTGSLLSIAKSVWKVYTLGTGSWRYVTTASEMLDYSCCSSGSLLNGNLHWLARDLTDSWWISCFDLETEVFTKFRAPIVESGCYNLTIGILGDRLCVTDNSFEGEIGIYLMNDYADGDISWNKEYVVNTIPDFAGGFHDVVYAVKAFADGDMLMVSQDFPVFCHYSNRSKAMAIVDDVFNVDVDDGFNVDDDDDGDIDVEAILYTPSFVSLKDLECETVMSLIVS